MRKLYLLVLLFAALLTGCSKSAGGGQKAFDMQMLDGEWQIVLLGEDRLPFEADEEAPNMLFDITNGSFACYVGCNRMGGNLLVGEDTLQMTDIFATRMYCPDKMETEEALGSALERVHSVRVAEDGGLLLTDGSGKVLITLAKERK